MIVKSNITLLDMKGNCYLKENEEVKVLMKDENGYYIELRNGLKSWFDKSKFKEIE